MVFDMPYKGELAMDIPVNYVRLEGSERHLAPEAHLLGPADLTETLSVSIRVRRRPDALPLPDLQSRAAMPPGQRKFLSHEDFSAQYGAAQADLDQVENFARDHGLTVVESSIPRRTVVVSGTVKQMSDAFAVELGRYESPTETYRGREGDIHLPNDLVDIVEGVFGLDNRRMARPAIRYSSASSTPPGASPLTPPQVAHLYNFPNGTATGKTIGILEFGGGYTMSDIQAFFNRLGSGFTMPTLTDVSVDQGKNTPGTDQDADSEVALDIDVASSVAPSANIAVYFAPFTEQGWIDVITTAVFDTTNAPSVLSISWGWPEKETFGTLTWTPAAIHAVNATFQDAAMLGVTVFAASGDDGSRCQINDRHAHVLYPASDPLVTACGGTIITKVSGSSFTEGTWNDDGITGGGISEVFPLPSWQEGAGVPLSINQSHYQGRGIPDIAGDASPYSGYRITWDKQTWDVGGTSAVAPLYAGLVALINTELSERVGYLNPTLYTLASRESNDFRDIADGVSNASGGSPGYTSGPGWDACTGLGVIKGTSLLNSLRVRMGAISWLSLLLLTGQVSGAATLVGK